MEFQHLHGAEHNRPASAGRFKFVKQFSHSASELQRAPRCKAFTQRVFSQFAEGAQLLMSLVPHAKAIAWLVLVHEDINEGPISLTKLARLVRLSAKTRPARLCRAGRRCKRAFLQRRP